MTTPTTPTRRPEMTLLALIEKLQAAYAEHRPRYDSEEHLAVVVDGDCFDTYPIYAVEVEVEDFPDYAQDPNDPDDHPPYKWTNIILDTNEKAGAR